MFQNRRKQGGTVKTKVYETDIAKTREIAMHSNCRNESKMTLQKFVKQKSLRDLTGFPFDKRKCERGTGN